MASPALTAATRPVASLTTFGTVHPAAPSGRRSRGSPTYRACFPRPKSRPKIWKLCGPHCWPRLGVREDRCGAQPGCYGLPSRRWWSLPPLWLVHERNLRTDHLVGRDTLASSAPPGRLHRGVVHPGNAAVFSLMQGQPDEVVVLRQGEITVEVERLAENERFRVLTGDAAVEVKGTIFSAIASDDQLMVVGVTRGQVIVRVQGRAPVTLGPNDRWDRAVDQQAIAPRRRDWPGPSQKQDHSSVQRDRSRDRRLGLLRSEHPTDKTPARQSAAESAFADGWQALRSDRLAEAATAFDRAVNAAGNEPLSEDAWFWLAVCQARIPRPVEARSTLAAFIARFPHSPRLGEAADMLGWQLVDSGDLDGAQRAFATAALDPGASIRRSAKGGFTRCRSSAARHRRRGASPLSQPAFSARRHSVAAQCVAPASTLPVPETLLPASGSPG